ncbi:MAG: GNAT family N-acetyltransferase [Eubacteriales bacterium]
MEIRMLDKKIYAGQKFTIRYQTNGYYEITAKEYGFRIEHKAFETTVEKSFDDVFFSEWLDDPVSYGVFENERLLGFAEGFLEKWNNRYRISNICIFDDADRRRGIGTLLMNTILKEADSSKARMAVLETQTCNENAIAFYQRNGFEIIGFDLYSYSNTDPEKHEVRIEMGKKLS